MTDEKDIELDGNATSSTFTDIRPKLHFNGCGIDNMPMVLGDCEMHNVTLHGCKLITETEAIRMLMDWNERLQTEIASLRGIIDDLQ